MARGMGDVVKSPSADKHEAVGSHKNIKKDLKNLVTTINDPKKMKENQGKMVRVSIPLNLRAL